MSELTTIVIGLQRLGDAAQTRGDDLRYVQEQQRYDHINWLDQQLDMVEKVRSVLLQERKRFTPVEKRPEPQVNQIPQQKEESVPKFLKQGPAA